MKTQLFDVGKFLRTAQTRAPRLVEFKYWIQFHYRKLLARPFESDFELLASFSPDPAEAFIDVGANRGQSIQAIRMFQPHCPVWSFEPSAHSYERLCRYTSKVNGINVVHAGLGKSRAQLTLFTPIYRGFVFDGLASTMRDAAADWLVDRIYNFDEKYLEIREESIDIYPLDKYEFEPALIKIDVQGAEMEVLLGAANTIAKSKPLIMLESPRKEVETAWLLNQGYKQYTWSDGFLKLGNSGVNVWFVPDERMTQLSDDLFGEE